MSDKPEIELDLDLQLLPAWARQPQEANRYANFEDSGRPERSDRPGFRGRGPGGPRRDFRGEGRPGGFGGPPRGPRPGGGGPGGGPGSGTGRPPRGDRREGFGGRRSDGPPRREPPMEELPEGITVDLIPEPSGVDSLTRQIRQTGRAYPLFDIGHLILKRPDRYQLDFRTTGNLPDGSPRQLYLCSLDDTVWMSEGEAVRHVLARHFDTFYQTEKIPVDPPKGTYTFVAQCGMSGVVLGPPNLHDYQAKLQRLHSERFSRLPFDVFKSRVKIVRDEAVVKQWIEQQSFKFEFICLNLPEPLKLGSREAVEQHFREVHLPSIIRAVSSHIVRTPAARDALPPPLRRLARREFDHQQRFPLKLVTRLSEDFAHRGLHFFKVNKTVLHVAVARPRYLDVEANPVTEGVKRILDAINATPDCNRRRLLEALGVPIPAAPSAPVAPAPAPPAPAEAGAAAPAQGATAPAPTPAPASEPPPSPELQAIVTDLHWLIHEGHVIEFANGRLEAAKKPAPRPQPTPRPQRPKTQPTPAVSDAPASDSGAEGATGSAEPAVADAEAAVAEESQDAAGDEAAGQADSVPDGAAVADAAPANEAAASPETPTGPEEETRINPS